MSRLEPARVDVRMRGFTARCVVFAIAPFCAFRLQIFAEAWPKAAAAPRETVGGVWFESGCGRAGNCRRASRGRRTAGKELLPLVACGARFNPDHLATLQVATPVATYKTNEQHVALARRVVSRLATLPGVKSVALTTLMPVSFNGNTDWIRFVGRAYHGEHNEVNERDVSSDYFATLQAKLLRGRFFSDAEDASKPRVAIINQALAKQYFPGEDPIGKKFGDDGLTPNSIREIIGVVDDIKEGPLDSQIWPAEYLPFNQCRILLSPSLCELRRTKSRAPILSAAVREIDPNLGILNETT